MSKISKITDWYFNKKSLPYWFIFLVDCAIVLCSYLFIFQQLNSGTIALSYIVQLTLLSTLLVMCYVVGFRLFHTYDGILRYSSFYDLKRVLYAIAFGTVPSIFLCPALKQISYFSVVNMTTANIFLASLLSILLMWTVRVIAKTIFDESLVNIKTKVSFIYGVNDSGIGVAKLIRTDKPMRFKIKGFIANTNQKQYGTLMGVKVYRLNHDIMSILHKNNIDALVISPDAVEEFRTQRTLQDNLISEGISIYMPQRAQKWNPDQQPQLKEVSIEDLLPRDEINVDLESLGKMLKGKCVLITGSAGSIGSEIVRQVADFKPSEMVLIDSAETPQHDIRLMMRKQYPDIKAETIVTTICSKTRMENIFQTYHPDYVFHAAAYKHVSMMENNPCESILNNVYGTKILADLSAKHGTSKFVMISTDKAVNPTNVMGCSKRICEIYVQSLSKAIWEGKIEGITQFVTTRFGNVLGSNGSVIPLFKKQIRKGGPVTVTDPNIIRFFMLIPEACKLVLEAGIKGNGGEIFVFDMGKPVKIADLAQRMINLSGAKGVKIQYTGLRAGEKLYEEVLNAKETTLPSFNKKIRIAKVREYDYFDVEKQIEELISISKSYDDMATVKKMKEIVPEYISNNSIYEKLDKK